MSVTAIHAFWHGIRQGRRAKQRTSGVPCRVDQMDSSSSPSLLAAHRARLEHDVLFKHAIPDVRSAAKEYDAWRQAELAKKRARRGRGDGIAIPKRKRSAA